MSSKRDHWELITTQLKGLKKMKRKNIWDVSLNLPPLPHTHPQTLLKPLVLCRRFTSCTTCPEVTDPHLRQAGGRGPHITKADPNIGNSSYRESHHWSNPLVSTYYVRGRDRGQMSQGRIKGLLHFSPTFLIAKHIKGGHCPETSSSIVRCFFTCSPSLLCIL